MLVHQILEHNRRVVPDRVAVLYRGEEVTYRELDRGASRCAFQLEQWGVRKGDRVALLSKNSLNYVEVMYGLMKLGAVLTPLNFLLLPGELSRIVTDLKPRFLLFSLPFEEKADEISHLCPSVERALSLNDLEEGFHSTLPGDEAIPHTCSGGRDIRENDIAMIVYAGPSGNRQKGVMLTHRNLTSASLYSVIEMNITREDVYLSTAPLPFLAGTGRMLKFLIAGAKVVIMDDFDPLEALDFIEAEGVTHLLLVPQMMAALTRELDLEPRNLESLSQISYSGVVPVESALLENCVRHFPCTIRQSFAQVESSGIITFLRVDEELARGRGLSHSIFSSIGKETLGGEVKIIDPAGKEVAPDMIGELTIRGSMVMEGYFHDPLLTKETLKDGWLHTGYMASMDDEGNIYVVDRKKEMIIRGGVIIDPEEVGEIIQSLEGVKEVAVVAMPDTDWGELPAAVVTLEEGSSLTREEIISWAEGKMAPFKIPHTITIVSVLPRNSAGKILKARIKNEVAKM